MQDLDDLKALSLNHSDWMQNRRGGGAFILPRCGL